MTIEMTCPTCGSHDIAKNGTTRRGKQTDEAATLNCEIGKFPLDPLELAGEDVTFKVL